MTWYLQTTWKNGEFKECINVFFPEPKEQTFLCAVLGDASVQASPALVVTPVEVAAPSSHHKAKDSGGNAGLSCYLLEHRFKIV